ncbi:hypothetical protein EDD21DRAFT_362281 [Dissophora ornata]|nr:hypothetical protein BGZ58_000311 [Dissophora ornata]KAI8605945.1 hypothetical protein EDD21DRAFT_362281 [Dissophora ornata]
MHFTRSFTTIALGLISLMALASVSQAHVGLLRPCARGSPRAGCPAPSNGQAPDYDLNSPIGTHDSQTLPICKNTIPQANPTVLQAGQDIQTSYSVGAPHGGGHCQWALSYDGGKTWVVLKTMIRTCLQNVAGGQDYSVAVPLPATAPNGKAVFMWLWNNAIGNREMYSNCADVMIQGGANGGSISGVAPLFANYGPQSLLIPEFPLATQDDKHTAFDSRPAITVRA